MSSQKRFLTDESGATSIEYALLAAMISIVLIGGMTAFGAAMSNMFFSISTQVTTAAP